MFRNFTEQVTSHSTRSNGLLKQIKLPLFISKYLQCSLPSTDVNRWLDTLAEDKRKRVKLIQNEIALKQAESKKIPKLDTLQISDFEAMLDMSNSRRHRYYCYLFAKSSAITNYESKKMIRQKTYDEKKESGTLVPVSKHLQYGLGKNTMILRIKRQTMMKWRNAKCHRAMMRNETPLIFDCGFCDAMSKFEIKETAKQLIYSFSQNRLSLQPFVMNLCNINKGSLLWQELIKNMPNIEKMPLKIHSGDPLEIFPSENLVYLSPDASVVMDEFNADDQYVIGSIVDKGNQAPLTHAKAKKVQVRSVRFPLDKYIRFHSHKNLTLDQVTNILLELRKTQDWSKALRHVPGRKMFS